MPGTATVARRRSRFANGINVAGTPTMAPSPLRTQPSMRLAPHTDRMNILSWEGFALPNPPTGWGSGETRFPQTPRRGLMFTLE